MLKQLQKFISSFIAATFVVAVFVCLNIGFQHPHVAISSCCVPAPSHASVNHMDAGDHAQQWQQTFIVMHRSSDDVLVLLGMLLLSLGFISFTLRFRNFEVNQNLFSAKVYKARNAIKKLFDPLVQALSNGLLNGRLYEVSSVTRSFYFADLP